jgi:hypothetical protein
MSTLSMELVNLWQTVAIWAHQIDEPDPSGTELGGAERVLDWQPTGPNHLDHRDGLVARHGRCNQVASHLPF